jgi:hypothetical protein
MRHGMDEVLDALNLTHFVEPIGRRQNAGRFSDTKSVQSGHARRATRAVNSE